MMIILFKCRGDTESYWKLAVLVGRDGANRGVENSDELRFYYE